MLPKNKKVSFNTMRNIVFFSLIIVLLAGLAYLFSPFFYPIFWAGVVAVLFYPIYSWLAKHTRSKNLSATIVLILVLALIILPLLVLVLLIVRESFTLYEAATNAGIFSNAGDAVGKLHGTFLGPYIETVQSQWANYASQAARNVSSYLFTSLASITGNTLRLLFMLFVMLYTLFYFLRDGSKMLKRLMHLAPLGDKYETLLYTRFTSTSRATLKSTILVGGLQGISAAILFAIAGVPGVVVWGSVMTLLAIIPVVGAFIIWLPAGVILLATGQVTGGLVILIGGFIISWVDNPIRAALIGNDAEMHPMIAFFSTMGGLIFFGISGFVIGPIIAALFLSVMAMYDEYYKTELQKN